MVSVPLEPDGRNVTFSSHQEQLTDLGLSPPAGRPHLVLGTSCRSSPPFSRCTPSMWRISIKLWSCWNSGPTALLSSRPPFRRYRCPQKCLAFWNNGVSALKYRCWGNLSITFDRARRSVARWRFSITCWSRCRESHATRCCSKTTWRSCLGMTLTGGMRKASPQQCFHFPLGFSGFIWVFSRFSRVTGDYRHSSYPLQQRHPKIREFGGGQGSHPWRVDDPLTLSLSVLRRTWRSCWRYTRCWGRRRTLSTPQTSSSKRATSWNWRPGTPQPWSDTSFWWEKLSDVSSAPLWEPALWNPFISDILMWNV